MIDAFLTAIGNGTTAGRVMAEQWRSAGLLRVERAPPLTLASGKILHLHRRGRERPANREAGRTLAVETPPG